MKRLAILAIGAIALNFAAAAAQCEGVTKTGERCKREPAENSAYCIGHAEQAKTKAPEKEKDDGTCWAITDAGKRCKHKKDGESDYCKQHAPGKAPAHPVDRCRAMTWEGTQCGRKPVDGRRYCKQHMGKSVQ